MNNLPKVVTQQRRGRASNPRLLDRKSDALPLSHRATQKWVKLSKWSTTATQLCCGWALNMEFFTNVSKTDMFFGTDLRHNFFTELALMVPVWLSWLDQRRHCILSPVSAWMDDRFNHLGAEPGI